MMFVALRMLVGDRLKYLGLVVGIAFSTLLITQQASILVGLAWQTGAFIRDTSQADLWVMDEQVRFSQDALALPDTTLSRVRGVEGVSWAVPLYEGFVRARLPDGTRMLMILIGIDDATLIGGPPTMVEGRLADLRQDRAVLIDAEAAATKMKLKRDGNRPLRVGDSLSINDSELRVAGTYRASKSFFWEPMIYTTYSRALSVAPKERKMMAFVMVKAQAGQDLGELSRRIESTTRLKCRTNDQFIEVTTNYILKETGILINFGMAVGLGFLIGTLVTGQMLYNFTIDNLRHYGALRAMGATSGTLIVMVAVQALVVGAMGYGIGLGAGTLLGRAVASGGLAFRMPWEIPALAAGAILTICLASAVLSLVRVLRLEPAIVFK
ncbi:MAG: ABC transporter permease [Phycisphaerales bacterium]